MENSLNLLVYCRIVAARVFCLRTAKLTMRLALAPVTVTDVIVIPVTNAGCDDKTTEPFV